MTADVMTPALTNGGHAQAWRGGRRLPHVDFSHAASRAKGKDRVYTAFFDRPLARIVSQPLFGTTNSVREMGWRGSGLEVGLLWPQRARSRAWAGRRGAGGTSRLPAPRSPERKFAKVEWFRQGQSGSKASLPMTCDVSGCPTATHYLVYNECYRRRRLSGRWASSFASFPWR